MNYVYIVTFDMAYVFHTYELSDIYGVFSSFKKADKYIRETIYRKNDNMIFKRMTPNKWEYHKNSDHSRAHMITRYVSNKGFKDEEIYSY